MTSFKIFSRNTKFSICFGAICKDYCMMCFTQIFNRYISTNSYICNKIKVWIICNFFIEINSGFEFWMIRRNTTSNKTIRGGETFNNIYIYFKF